MLLYCLLFKVSKTKGFTKLNRKTIYLNSCHLESVSKSTRNLLRSTFWLTANNFSALKSFFVLTEICKNDGVNIHWAINGLAKVVDVKPIRNSHEMRAKM